jgi:predicted outer membrane repeat protein
MGGSHTATTVIQGLTIRGARNHGIKCGTSTNSASPSIYDCVIVDNGRLSGSADGGGIAFTDGRVWDCRVIGNKAGHNGGGIFTDQAADIRRCKIKENEAANVGGGVAKGASIESTLICRNSAKHGGGTGNGDVRVWNCVYASNTANQRGGAAYNHTGAEFYNNAFENNSAKYGGALADITGGSAGLENNIFHGNSASQAGTDTNNCVNRHFSFFNTGNLPANGNGNISALTPAQLNVPLDPSDPEGWDFHLSEVSPCFDAARNLIADGTFSLLIGDFDNPPTPRSVQINDVWDIGPDEQ